MHPIRALLAFLVLIAAGAAARAQSVPIGVLPLVSSAPVFIAAERGYFKAEGIDAELKFFQAAQPVAVAVAGGDVQFGVTAFSAGFFNLAGKGALQVIGAQSREEPGFDFSAYVVAAKAHDEGFRAVAQFPGKTLGMTQVGSSFHYMLGRLAEKRGFALDTVKIKPLQSIPNMVAALKGAQVDALIVPANIAGQLQSEGAGRIIGWVHEETPWQLGALFTATKTVAERPDLVRRFIRAYQKGATDYHEAFNARENGRRVFGAKADALMPIIEKHTKSTPADIKAGAPFIDPMGRLLVGDIYHQVRWLKANGFVDAEVDAKTFLALQFIDGHRDVP